LIYRAFLAALAACLCIEVFAPVSLCAQPPVAAAPFVRILSPAPEQIVTGPDVVVQFEAGNMCFTPCGNNLHFFLDNEPFEAQFDANHPHRFQDVLPGTHTIRVLAANQSHEAIAGTMDLVTFSVMYPDEDNRPEYGEPLLTYNLPQGEYRGVDCADIAVNFLVTGVPLSKHGYHVNYFVDGRRYIVYDCFTRHVKDLAPGFHTVKIELADEKNRIAPGPFNRVERTILLSPDKEPFRLIPGELPPEQPVLSTIHGAMTAGQAYDTFIEKPVPHNHMRERAEEIVVNPAAETDRKAELTVRRDVKPIDIQPATVPSRGQDVEVKGPEVETFAPPVQQGTIETKEVQNLDNAETVTSSTEIRTRTTSSPLTRAPRLRRERPTTATLQTVVQDGQTTVVKNR
jgi:hypothetical protein